MRAYARVRDGGGGLEHSWARWARCVTAESAHDYRPLAVFAHSAEETSSRLPDQTEIKGKNTFWFCPSLKFFFLPFRLIANSDFVNASP